MKPWVVINDIHLGVNRTGGTTQKSLGMLWEYSNQRLQRLLDLSNRIIINGDLFDSYQVPASIMLNAYGLLAAWVGSKPARRLCLIGGNHDFAKSSINLSSFEVVSHLLQAQYEPQVTLIRGAGWVDESEGIYAISHVLNQELFDEMLHDVPEQSKWVLLHANYDNTFAAESRHSLNVTRAQVKVMTDRGVRVVFGHEHQGRTLMAGKVIIVGNQFPTSVSDCLRHGDAQSDGTKRALEISGDGYTLIPTWSADDPIGGYAEMPWDNLKESTADFIRVTGEASAEQAAEVIRAVSTYRQRSDAFVITNAVKVERADEGLDDIAESVEDIRSVNVIDLLLEMLDPDQQAAIRQLTGATQ